MNEDINYLIDNAEFDKKPLLNYITNLQEELKEVNESLTWWTNRFNAVERDNRKLVKVFDELEEWLNEEIIINKTNQIEDPNYPEWYIKWNCYLNILNKLTELKGGSDDVEN